MPAQHDAGSHSISSAATLRLSICVTLTGVAVQGHMYAMQCRGAHRDIVGAEQNIYKVTLQ